MGMTFEMTVTATVLLSAVDLSDLGIDAERAIEYHVGGAIIEDAIVSEAVADIEVTLRLENVSVSAEDLLDFDGRDAVEETVTHWNANITDISFEVSESPVGFEAVEDATDRDTALSVYAALAAAGFEVS